MGRKNQETTRTAILEFVNRSTEIERHFRQKYKKVCDERKKSGTDAYFPLLEYSPHFRRESNLLTKLLKLGVMNILERHSQNLSN